MAGVGFLGQRRQRETCSPGLEDDRIAGAFQDQNEIAVADQPTQGNVRPGRFFRLLEIGQRAGLTNGNALPAAATGTAAAAARLIKSPLSLQVGLVRLVILILCAIF